MKTTTAVLLALIIIIVLLALNLTVFWPDERQAAAPDEAIQAGLAPPDVRGPETLNPIMKYGYPGTAMIRYRDGYVLSYDARNRVPFWVCELLDADLLKGSASRVKSSFRVDTSIPVEFRSSNDDYERSGFDRGHMAPAGDHKKSRDEMDETFFLSNMAPQAGAGFNRGYWADVEGRIRDWAGERRLYVYTGPLYLPEEAIDGGRYVRYRVIGDGRVAVPTHFFKVILAESGSGVEVLALVLPNENIRKNTPLSRFMVSVDDLERMSGLDFMDVLDDGTEAMLEREVLPDYWLTTPLKQN
ncbi:MAG: DNA/RNA non-specific endonuclease [Nitrospirae bacterium]|nr:DNA/RNA non-specific endonuclease [Nitrospirota bacterium]